MKSTEYQQYRDMVRREPDSEDGRRDLSSTNLSVRAETIDEPNRSVEVVLATERAVTVFDWNNWRMIDEVLLMSGREIAPHVPLLDNHMRSNDNVFGSFGEFRQEGNQLIARMTFVNLLEEPTLRNDPEALRVERAWVKVKQNHNRNVSVGYRVIESVDIPAGESRKVNGKVYRAGDRALRVAVKWIVREGSLTPVGADSSATTRHSQQWSSRMNKKLRKRLESLGLRSDATETEAWDHLRNLGEQQRNEALGLIDTQTDFVPDDVRSLVGNLQNPTPAIPPQTPPATPDPARSEGQPGQPTPPATPPATPPGGNYIPGERLEQTVNDAVTQAQQIERDRVRQIHEIFGTDEPELRQRAIYDGWTAERASQELLPFIRRRQSEPVGFQGGIHSRGASNLNADALQFALLMREAPQIIESNTLMGERARMAGLTGVLTSDINSDEKQRALDMAYQYRNHSLVDFCDLALRMNPQTASRVPHDREEMIRMAISSGSLNTLFTTNVHARLFVAYEDAPDSTMGWCSEVDNQNFMQHEAITMGKVGNLTKHGRGGTADHMDGEADMEPYRIARFSGQSTVDEMDIIDNRFGGTNSLANPEDMGRSAKQLRPNLVYGLLHANANLTHTGRALFNATDGNLITGAPLSIAALEAAEIALSERRIRDRPLNLSLDFVIVPRQLKWKLLQILSSAERRQTSAGSTDEGIANPISQENIEVRTDARLGPGGATDPETGTKHTGTATNFVTASRPGANGAKTVQVAYRSGTGRAPRIRASVLAQGKYGINFDINMDIGVKALDHEGINFHTGA